MLLSMFYALNSMFMFVIHSPYIYGQFIRNDFFFLNSFQRFYEGKILFILILYFFDYLKRKKVEKGYERKSTHFPFHI
jgi:hypothetical protein